MGVGVGNKGALRIHWGHGVWDTIYYLCGHKRIEGESWFFFPSISTPPRESLSCLNKKTLRLRLILSTRKEAYI